MNRPRLLSWQWMASAIVLLAAVLTVVVYGETILRWFIPASAQEGELAGDLFDSPFRLPTNFSAWPPVHQKFIGAAHCYARVSLYNDSGVDLMDVEVALPTEALIEIQRPGKAPQTLAPAEAAHLGLVNRGEHLALLLWMNRQLAPDERVTVRHSLGVMQLNPVALVWSDDIQFYQQGFKLLLLIVAVLGCGVVVMAGLLMRTKRNSS